jgi:hypothetical protein
LVEEAGVPGENIRAVASHWQTLSHNVISSIRRLGFELTKLVVIGTDCISSYKSNYHTITTTSSPRFFCRPTAFCSTCWSRGTSERSPQGKQRIYRSNSGLAHFHVSWLSDCIFFIRNPYINRFTNHFSIHS